ncbi:extracellular solute-binding protein family 3 [Gloeothece citriformis PCC 7424]|uniref:Extracellular solute-binding protein family 3 n=1 Tax=Gloeothece citriformis (strain PCC 7424) TaxID=65393 RepID=B7KF80_GLOC7|nr:transporter substrate-binding domain-containing protein [Gloeothece citriformis]ACK71796.1 extracellular solute-binding protein family 3 [Gloeothece citriformis PCC 7424]
MSSVQASPKLRVGIYVADPFVIETDSFSVNNNSQPQTGIELQNEFSDLNSYSKSVNFQGISIDVWEEIAVLENFNYVYFRQETVEDGINAIVKGEIDLLIGSIAITPERLQKVSFTQPYYSSTPALLVKNTPLTFWDVIHPFLRVALISSLSGVLIIHSLIAHLIWLVERHHNSEQFPKEYHKGIREAFWFAAVTMTTVGYGDKVPITKLGRLIAFIWMWMSMVMVSSITAVLATTFTLSLSQQSVKKFSNPEDLRGTKVAVVSGTDTETILKKYQMQAVETKTVNGAINLLFLEQVQAVLSVETALKYYQHEYSNQSLAIVPLYSLPVSYGFALSKKQSFRTKN